MVRVVGVHGVRNLRQTDSVAASAELSAIWSAHLARGMAATVIQDDVSVAYYADILNLARRRDGAQGAEPDLDSLDAAETRALVSWALACGVTADSSQGYVTAPLKWLVSAVADRFGLDRALARLFIAAFFREVATYMNDEEARSAAQTAVAEQLERHAPSIVIAHSLGSVVAYETLWNHDHPPIDVLVTVGSPLALPDLIFDRLTPKPGADRGAKPPNVVTWINLADPGDVIAVPPYLSRKFDGLDVDAVSSIGAFKFHAVGGYLEHPAVATAIASHLK